MKAVTSHGIEDVRVDDVPDPSEEPTDAVVRITSTAICGSDLYARIFPRGEVVAVALPEASTRPRSARSTGSALRGSRNCSTRTAGTTSL